MRYRVSWHIDVEAEDVREAARKAREAQTREGTHAAVFDVHRADGPSVRVDLMRDQGGKP